MKFELACSSDPLSDIIILFSIVYPSDIEFLKNISNLKRILSSHGAGVSETNFNSISKDFRAQIIENTNILTLLLPNNYLLGLLFEDIDDNPYDYIDLIKKEVLEFFKPIIESNHKYPTKESLTTIVLTTFIETKKWESEVLLYEKEKNLPTFMPLPDLTLKIFVFGLDNAGKSSYIRFIQTGKYDKNFFPPTKQFKIYDLEYQGIHLSIWDMAGQKIFRKNWALNAQASNIALFFLDGADESRYEEAKNAFYGIINNYDIRNIPFLFVVNKIDLKLDISKDYIIEYFNLNLFKERIWDVHLISVEKGIGVHNSINWIMKQIELIEEAEYKTDL